MRRLFYVVLSGVGALTAAFSHPETAAAAPRATSRSGLTLGKATQSVTVVVPNGGQYWAPGTPHTVYWQSEGLGGGVRIWLYKGGVKTTMLAYSRPIADGSWTWFIPSDTPVGDDYRIRIQSTENYLVDDFSDADFFIQTAPPPVTLLSPNGGEVWGQGSAHAITWNTYNYGGWVSLYLRRGSEAWNLLVLLAWGPNHSWPWQIPYNLAPGNDYQVRIHSYGDNPCDDVSDGTFTIEATPAIRVIYPNGGETFARGLPRTITWTSQYLGDGVRIWLYKAGAKNLMLSYSRPIAPGSWVWHVPPDLPLGTNYKIRLQSTEDYGVDDFGDGNFTITPTATIQVLSPNGGELWTIGETRTITWASTYLGGKVRIWLYKGGEKQRMLAMAYWVSKHAWSWPISEDLQPGSDYQIRLQSTDYFVLDDFSDTPFTLALPR